MTTDNAVIQKLEAENLRLRKALKEIARYKYGMDGAARGIAEDALEGK